MLEKLSELIREATMILQTKDGIHEVSVLMHDRAAAERLLELLEEVGMTIQLPETGGG